MTTESLYAQPVLLPLLLLLLVSPSFPCPPSDPHPPLSGVGEVKDRVTVSFGKHSFDLKVMDLAGRNYRLVNNNLEKDILPEQSSFIVKKNRLVIKLQKVKGKLVLYACCCCCACCGVG